ncbi:hypothetical protein BS17DRAFT_249048 [Gyrodon lividus]|nr:hypothetical protein BS17DRAFT_249048 [Gyrodon lividus]
MRLAFVQCQFHTRISRPRGGETHHSHSYLHQYDAIMQGILTCLASTFLLSMEAFRLIETPRSVFFGFLITTVASGVSFSLNVRQHSADKHDWTVQTRRLLAVVVSFSVTLRHMMNISEPPPSHSGCRGGILLILSFNHTRYNNHLNSRKRRLFPKLTKIVYTISPASREDKGFPHSYDISVDLFQLYEDLSDPLFYKYVGTNGPHAAHCPARQINQSLFWSHSPSWGRPSQIQSLAIWYLSHAERKPTCALCSHLPRCICPSHRKRGWDPDWCPTQSTPKIIITDCPYTSDPHVGLSVCMEDFLQGPWEDADLPRSTHQSTRLRGCITYTGPPSSSVHRAIGVTILQDSDRGSDNCPNPVVPPGAPFNTSSVRVEGFKVDTSHSFSWGSRGDNRDRPITPLKESAN